MGGGYTDVDCEDDFQEIVEKQTAGKLMVADFWAQWCGPCKLIGPYYEKLSKDPEFDDVLFIKVDVDELDGDLAEELGVECMPTFFFFRDGKLVDKMAGANKDKLLEFLRKYK